MLVICGGCGSYEIGVKAYEELESLAGTHWQIDYIRDGFKRIIPPVKIARTSTNIFEVRSLEERLTKMQKKIRRKNAKDGPPKPFGKIYYVGESDK